MLILGWDEFAVKVEQLVFDGLRFIEDGLGVTIQEMLIQLAATLVLFLAVRFLVWNKVTAILDERKKVVTEALKTRDDALEESKKCILVCANCHREIHADLIDSSTLHSSFCEEKAEIVLESLLVQKTKQKNYPSDDMTVIVAKLFFNCSVGNSYL